MKSEIDGTKFTSAFEESNQTNAVLLPSMLRSALPAWENFVQSHNLVQITFQKCYYCNMYTNCTWWETFSLYLQLREKQNKTSNRNKQPFKQKCREKFSHLKSKLLTIF